ncbi:hypothetical protein D3C77_705870 [compost metagenome]
MVRLHRLDHLRIHAQHGVQRHHRVLEDHRDLLAPQLAPAVRRCPAQVFTVQPQVPFNDAARLVQQTHQRKTGDALA